MTSSSPLVQVLVKQPTAAAARTAAVLRRGDHALRPNELPILRHQYVARNVRVLVGTRWKLCKFETRTVVLCTNPRSAAPHAAPALPTLTLGPATRPPRCDAISRTATTTTAAQQTPSSDLATVQFPLALDLTCVQSGLNELKLKLKLKRSSDCSDAATATRLKIRFATAADAAIWRKLVLDTLAHAQWAHHLDDVAYLTRSAASSVLVARHRASKQEFVVKALARVRVDDSACTELAVLKTLVASSRAAAALPHVCTYRVVETADDTQIVMPKLPGQTLLQFLRAQSERNASPQSSSLSSPRLSPHRLREDSARAVLEGICDQLDALHGAGIVHCDLKLENILVTDAATVRVIDFGGAYDLGTSDESDRRRLASTTTPQQRMVGTPGYIAPERILWVDTPPTPAADVFSAGIVLFQMLTGRQPFARASHQRALQIQDTLTLEWTTASAMLARARVSPAAIDLVQRMVASDPLVRITLEQIRAHAWLSPIDSALE